MHTGINFDPRLRQVCPQRFAPLELLVGVYDRPQVQFAGQSQIAGSMGSLQNQQWGVNPRLAERHGLFSKRHRQGIHTGLDMLRDPNSAMAVGIGFHHGHEAMRCERRPEGVNVLADGGEIDVNRCCA